MLKGRDAGIAMILKGESESPKGKALRHAGMGIVVSSKHVLTCAHVVNTAMCRADDVDERPGEDVRIDVVSPLVENGDPLKGRIVAWKPMTAEPVGDVAVLELDKIVPDD